MAAKPLNGYETFVIRSRVRKVARTCFMDCERNVHHSLRMAESQVKVEFNVLERTMYAAMLPQWIEEFLQVWVERNATPSCFYMPGEPGYRFFEDDES